MTIYKGISLELKQAILKSFSIKSPNNLDRQLDIKFQVNLPHDISINELQGFINQPLILNITQDQEYVPNTTFEPERNINIE